MNRQSGKHYFSNKLVEFRHSLSFIDALPQLTLLGFFVGLVTGVIIVSFRLLIDLPLAQLLPGNSENFEALPLQHRLMFIASGIIFLTGFLLLFKEKDREMSVSHVLDRTHNFQAKLPIKNWWVQFVGAIVALASGQSVGREGPVVHLGAGAASLFGQWLRLPNNSTQTLVGCGVAAAISASFDTPMAGVIFAMEILALEYTIVGFLPIILASVMGTVVSQAVLTDAGFINVGETNLRSLYEIPFMVVVGFVIAICAGIYVRLNILALKCSRYPLIARMAVAGLLTALTIIWVPQVMGQGYDTVNGAMEGELVLSTLAIVAIAKLLLTPVVIGLGIPGGLIGPLLVIGACVGGAIGVAAAQFFPELGAHPRFYVMMGMAGMMAAVLNAPLTALVTVLELSYNPNIIFPAMLVIVVACLTTRQIFKVQGVFVEQLRYSQRPLDFGPAKQALKRAGVRSVMDTRFVIAPHAPTPAEAASLLNKRPMWIIVSDENGRYSYVMPAADLANHLKSEAEKSTPSEAPTETPLVLSDIPSRTERVSAIHESASLFEAMQALGREKAGMLYVSGNATRFSGEVKGVLTLAAIENYYKPEELRGIT